MRAALVCRHKRRRAAWRTRGGGDSFSAEENLAAVPLDLHAQRGRQQRNRGALIALRFHQNELFLAPRAFSSIGHVLSMRIRPWGRSKPSLLFTLLRRRNFCAGCKQPSKRLKFGGSEGTVSSPRVGSHRLTLLCRFGGACGSSLVAPRVPFLLRVLAPIASHCFAALVERAGGARGRHALTCSLIG
jgi:hypothetical protein